MRTNMLQLRRGLVATKRLNRSENRVTMVIISLRSIRLVLIACSAYFLVCGLSALYIPALWLWSAGLPTTVSTELRLAFGVAGTYLCAFAFGCFIASMDPPRHRGIVLTVFVGNLLDFITTLQAIVVGSLPILQGSLFIVATVLWSAFLLVAWLSSARSS